MEYNLNELYLQDLYEYPLSENDLVDFAIKE